MTSNREERSSNAHRSLSPFWAANVQDVMDKLTSPAIPANTVDHYRASTRSSKVVLGSSTPPSPGLGSWQSSFPRLPTEPNSNSSHQTEGGLASLLARRTHAATLASSESSLRGREPKSSAIALGHGRPSQQTESSRASSAPTPSYIIQEHALRATSHAGPIRAIAIRQPRGPPGGVKELGERNFQTR